MRSYYIGGTSTFTTRLMSAATASWTFTMPTTAGVNLQVLQTDGSGNTSWSTVRRNPGSAQNYSVSTSVGSSAMTINLLAQDGSNPSTTNSVDILFRNTTASTGDSTFLSVTSALSVVVASGATLGHTSGVDQYIWLWAMNNSGTIELCVSGSKYFDEGSLQSSTAISGGSTDWKTLYGTSGRSNKPIRLLGRIKSNQATAGTYASNSTEISLPGTIPFFEGTQQLNDLTFTPTNFGSITLSDFRYYRVRDRMKVTGYWKCGTTAGATASIALPAGIHIDDGKYPTTASVLRMGEIAAISTAAGPNAYTVNGQLGPIVYDGSDNANLYLCYQSGSNVWVKINANSLLNTGDGASVWFEFPVKEWRSY